MELESIKKIYAGYSRTYDAIFKRFFFPRIKHAISTMDIKHGDRVLDVGVGTGLSLPLFPRYCNVVGIDISSAMLKQAREKAKKFNLNHVTLFEMDAMNIDFPDNSFDKVFISHVISVVPDPYRTISEVKRVCKNGGKIAIVNHFRSNKKMVGGIVKMLNPLTKKMGWRTDLSLEEFIQKAGLFVEKKYKLKKLDLWYVIFVRNEK